MSLFKNWERYFVDRDYKITLSKKWVHILNYLEIVDFSDTRIVIRYEGGNSVILGNHLTISRMQDEEILIEGMITSIEV